MGGGRRLGGGGSAPPRGMGVPCYDHGGSGLVLYIGVATMFLTCCNWSSS